MILKALTFDIIGTVFDAYDGLAQGVGPLNAKYGLNVQGSSFASGSLAGYVAGVGRFLSGQGWTPPDTILQDATAGLLPIQQLGPKAPQAIQYFFDLWRALPPWPDVAAGMQALHKHYTLAVLSNMSIATQTRLRAHAGLPFDKLLSGETVKAYKPNAAVYQMAVSSLNIRPAEILMVAAHNYDLNAANGQGFRTAFVGRPSEKGPAGSPGNQPDPSFDFNATSFIDLAEQLGADFVAAPDDCLAIDPMNLQVRQVAGNWTIVDDAQLVLDFGASKPNADRPRTLSRATGSTAFAISGARIRRSRISPSTVMPRRGRWRGRMQSPSIWPVSWRSNWGEAGLSPTGCRGCSTSAIARRTRSKQSPLSSATASRISASWAARTPR